MEKMKITTSRIFCLITFIGIILLPGCKTEPAKQPEFRAVWLHAGLFSQDETIAGKQADSLFDAYKETGINNLFCYNSMPGENGFPFDYLQMLIDKGRKRGIGIHPIFYPGYSINIEKEKAEHPDWIIRDMEANYLPYFNLANPEVQKYWLDKIKGALKYDIAGIHLDYMRFPTTQLYSYDSLTCEAFKKEYGYSPINVSHDCGSMIWCEWIKWNARQVTMLVSEINKAIDASGKHILYGIDVFPDLETSKVLIAQDWGSWAQKGLIDFLCPMLYTNNLDLLKEYTQNAINNVQGKCRIYPGIGVHTSHNNITKELIIKEIQLTRDLNTEGFAFFSGNSFNKEMRDTLNATLFR
jgi:uncharacterized lipoprotein YddW (UPF0748 family)